MGNRRFYNFRRAEGEAKWLGMGRPRQDEITSEANVLFDLWRWFFC